MNLVRQAGYEQRIYERGRLVGFAQGLIGGIGICVLVAAIIRLSLFQ